MSTELPEPNIKLISTDFDGTLFAEFENPPVPLRLQKLIGDLQARGAKWVINTGRDMSSLMETLARARITVEPDFLVLVEREIHTRVDSQYQGLEPWNRECTHLHTELFARILPDIPDLIHWINQRFHARIYEDPYSPLCLVAGSLQDADQIHEYLNGYCQRVGQLAVVRNDVYIRFSHEAYNKGSALSELTRRLGLAQPQVFAIGDHLNDLPMLSLNYARLLAAPSNAIPQVKSIVSAQGGYVCLMPRGQGVAEAIQHYLDGGLETRRI